MHFDATPKERYVTETGWQLAPRPPEYTLLSLVNTVIRIRVRPLIRYSAKQQRAGTVLRWPIRDVCGRVREAISSRSPCGCRSRSTSALSSSQHTSIARFMGRSSTCWSGSSRSLSGRRHAGRPDQQRRPGRCWHTEAGPFPWRNSLEDYSHDCFKYRSFRAAKGGAGDHTFATSSDGSTPPPLHGPGGRQPGEHRHAQIRRRQPVAGPVVGEP